MIQLGLILGMSFLSMTAFSQTTGPEIQRNRTDGKSAKTYLDIMINVASTSFNYGVSNSVLSDYKKSANGIQAGLSFQAGITPRFSLVTELYYMRKGGKLNADNPLTINESSIRLNTVEVPVLARIHMGNFYVNAGPSLAYNFSGNSKVADQSTQLVFDDSPGGFKRLDAGIQLGGGFGFPFKQKRIALDIRYNLGLTNITYDKELRNRAVMISVHFSNPWKKNPLGIK